MGYMDIYHSYRDYIPLMEAATIVMYIYIYIFLYYDYIYIYISILGQPWLDTLVLSSFAINGKISLIQLNKWIFWEISKIHHVYIIHPSISPITPSHRARLNLVRRSQPPTAGVIGSCREQRRGHVSNGLFEAGNHLPDELKSCGIRNIYIHIY